MEASVVDLPLPVGPVTRISPEGSITSSLQISGRPSSPISGMVELSLRMTMVKVPRWLATLMRKRPTPPRP